MATAKGFKGASSKSGASGSAREAMELPEWVMKKIEDLKDTMRLAKSPAELQLAAKEYDEVMKAISSDLRINGRQVAPNAKTITYDVGGGKFISRPRGEPAPDGGKPINLSMEEVTKILPPRPVVPENIVNKAEEVVSKAAPKPGEGPWGARPPGPAPYSGYGSRGTSEAAGTAQAAAPEAATIAREVLGERVSPRMTPRGPWDKPQFTPRVSPMQPEAITPSVGSLIAPAAVIGAGAGLTYKDDPEGFMRHLKTNFIGRQQPVSQGDSSPNPDNLPLGNTVSYSPEDFSTYNVPNNPDFNPQMWNPPVSNLPEHAGRENPAYGSPYDVTPPVPEYSGRENFSPPMGQEQRYRPMGSPGVTSMAREVLTRAQNTPQAQAQRAAAVLQQSPNELTVQKRAEQGPSFMTQLLRGDFREDSDQRIAEAMRRQREESGVDSSKMASGGAASKKTNKDDVLHKALEIIHHMLTRR